MSETDDPGDQAVDDVVVDATMDLLVARGFGRFSLRDVAERAGIEHADLVRAGDSLSDLVTLAVTRRLGAPRASADTGSFRGDLIAILTTIIDRVQSDPAVLNRAIAAFSHPDFRRGAVDETRLRLEVHRPAFERAVARGELDPDYDLQHCFELLLATPSLRWLEGRAVDPADAPHFVDLVLTGFASGAAPPR